MRFSIITTLSILLSLCLTTPLYADKVVSVADGDTITVLSSSNRQTKVRLYGIDTPEKKQAYGQKARAFTASLVAGKNVRVKSYDTDRYGRTVGVVYVDGINVNQKIVENGFAWVYTQYCKQSFCRDWKGLEANARSLNRGLWEDPHPVAPWEWRKHKRNGSSYTTTKSKAQTAYKPTQSVGRYHGNIKSQVYHSPSCRHYNCKNCTESLSSTTEAESKGYRPCSMCN